MRLSEIEACKEEFLTPQDISDVIGCSPQSIRDQAKDNPSALGFATMRIGSKTLIPRMAFLHWIRFGLAPIMETRSA